MTLVDNPLHNRRQGQHMLLAFFVGAVLLLNGCGQSELPLQLAGPTMGTSYHVTITRQDTVADTDILRSDIETRLEQINASMSTYRENSEISRFNRAASGEWHSVSAEFIQVFLVARSVTDASEGAYDVSIAPLVDLWGFGPQMGDTVPDDDAIARLLEQVGEQQVEVDEQGMRLLKTGALQLDFSSIAKGYAVDQLAELLNRRGITDYMVEIGGEVRVLGVNPRGEAWRIAIEQPRIGGGAPLAILALSSAGIATSGNYRNFFEVDGVQYSHSLDPRTGWPVQHELVSVTVVHPQVTLADAWATALTVLGPEHALRIATQQGLAAYLVIAAGTEIVVRKTPAIEHYLQ
ncbi:FAD:protein FMN transferase [Halieaceae bacterium IMCC14734]|uniref:FAD:protein FMN transferase n=1 Tax=Candidatus Litorirhabdus singularis TaxID=2518993 RepID=A0ABT3TGU0_9GAMM|nr:FAD:protein FMN transferase [Candidatus Litorirhabdus singularis]MCX2981420.1 FAD:protein FMN transferase [Candidatus Litorirhabdus singularis]